MLSSRLGRALDRPLESLAKKIPFSPNAISMCGFILTLLSSAVLAFDLIIGALCLLPVTLLDKLDGIVARVHGKSSKYGAFLDSVLDRLSDAAILIALAWNLCEKYNITGVIPAIISLSGSLTISYIRAKAESLGVSCDKGLMERPERLILLFLGAVSGYVVAALWILSILTHVTIAERVLYARRQLIRL